MDNTVVGKARSFPIVFVSSSVARKFVMAITGFASFGYVAGHMVGNLQIYAGQNQINKYAEFLHSLGPGLWVIRLVLFTFFAFHIWLGIKLKLENWAARPDSYARKKELKTGLAARTMIWTGSVVLAFVVYHIMQFTVRSTDPRFAHLVDPVGRYDVYSMVILGFQNVWVSVFYIVAVGLLCYHLSHGVWSMFQSLGWNNKRSEPWLKAIAYTFSTIIFLGFISIPLSVLSGYLKLPSGGAL
jgi:succinate dehydrogenase / fumarate reductase cytochrome b subunit